MPVASWIAKRLGERIRVLRESQGLSQEELGERAGIPDKGAVSLFENGKRDFRVREFLSFAKALGADPEGLLKSARRKQHERKSLPDGSG